MKQGFNADQSIKEIWVATGQKPITIKYSQSNNTHVRQVPVKVCPWSMQEPLPPYGLRGDTKSVDREGGRELLCFTFHWHVPYSVIQQYSDEMPIRNIPDIFSHPNLEFEDRTILKMLKAIHDAEERHPIEVSIKAQIPKHIIIAIDIYVWSYSDNRRGEAADYYYERRMDK